MFLKGYDSTTREANKYSDVKHFATQCLFILVSLISISDAFATETIPYGSKAGMEVTVVEKVGIGTAKATIYTKHTAKNARAFCVKYGQNYSKACVDDVLATTKLKDHVTGDCVRKAWQDINGDSYSFHGRNKISGQFEPEFVIKHNSGSTLEPSNASGYYIQLATFKMLCPDALNSKKVTSSGTQAAKLPFVGKWAPTLSLCIEDVETTDNGPIKITQDGIFGYDLFYCGIDRITGGPEKWMISVTCNNEGNPYKKRVALELIGDRLIYQSLGQNKWAETYFRCQ